MLYLILAVITGASVSFVLRLSKPYVKNEMVLFAVNYVICFALARLFMGKTDLIIHTEGLGFALIAGAIAGALYLINFILLQSSMHYNGLVLSTTFMKLGVIVPTLMAIAIFREQPSIIQAIGLVIAIVAIVMIHFEKTSEETTSSGNKGYKYLLIVLLLAAGITDSMANIYDNFGNPELENHYLFYVFIAAFIFAAIISFRRKEKVTRAEILWGTILGIPNYLSARFLLLSLGSVPAVITYPVYSVGSIILITIAGVLMFKEKLSKQKIIALVLIIAALVLLNM